MNHIEGQAVPVDTWASGGSYQMYVGRWSRLVADKFAVWLGAPPRKSWLDVGCGTGALTQAILGVAAPATVKAIDPSQGYISFARENIRDSRVDFEAGTLEFLRLPNDSFDVAVSGLVLNFMPDPAWATSEMKRLVGKGGIIGAYVWDYADKMELIRYFWDAAVALDETARLFDEGRRFPLCKPEPLKELFAAAGLQNVEVGPLDVPTILTDFNEYWEPFLGGQGPAPTYVMSLNEDQRGVLRDRIHSRLHINHDGSINLKARAWVIKGRKP